jgi:hypothetical protein
LRFKIKKLGLFLYKQKKADLGRQLSPDQFLGKAGLDAAKRPAIIDKRFCAKMSTKNASQTF